MLAEFKQPMCGSLKSRLPFRIPFAMLHCNTKLPGYVLCELGPETNLTQALIAQHLLETVQNSTNHAAQSIHMTESFTHDRVSTLTLADKSQH